MITAKQQQWLDHLTDDHVIEIFPWDPTCEEKFLRVKEELLPRLGEGRRVLHRGASSLGISGQDEIDVYVPVPEKDFDDTMSVVATMYGSPRSHYPLVRARFVVMVETKHVDVFVINEEDENWIDSEIFHRYVSENVQALEEYRLLKENRHGWGTRSYYTAKTEFVNSILALAGQ